MQKDDDESATPDDRVNEHEGTQPFDEEALETILGRDIRDNDELKRPPNDRSPLT